MEEIKVLELNKVTKNKMIYVPDLSKNGAMAKILENEKRMPQDQVWISPEELHDANR
jgi:hypothetical protein